MVVSRWPLPRCQGFGLPRIGHQLLWSKRPFSTACPRPLKAHPAKFLSSITRSVRWKRDFFNDSADGRLDEFSLLDAALVASGVRRTEDLRRYERQLTRLVDELQALEREETTSRDRAEIVFDFLHQHVLSGGYGLQCTDLRLAFDQGRYNCVSASVMYNCLATGCGLEVCGLEMPNHAMSRVVLDGQPLDVGNDLPHMVSALAGSAPSGRDDRTSGGWHLG